MQGVSAPNVQMEPSTTRIMVPAEIAMTGEALVGIEIDLMLLFMDFWKCQNWQSLNQYYIKYLFINSYKA